MERIKLGLGIFFGAGMLPKAPGTWGSFAALPCIYLSAMPAPVLGIPAFILITSFLSLWSADTCVKRYGQDPPQFVMDEVAGQGMVFLFSSFSLSVHPDLTVLFSGFILFRIFDIAKPLGINAVEKLAGKFGILLDDLLAGTYALICLELLKWLFRSV